MKKFVPPSKKFILGELVVSVSKHQSSSGIQGSLPMGKYWLTHPPSLPLPMTLALINSKASHLTYQP